MTPTPDPTAHLAARIVALGREGLAQVEIAAALGVGVRELEGMARDDAAVALALDRAEAAAMAWWAAAPRQAMAMGARFPWVSWRRAVAWLTEEARRGACAPEPAAPARSLAIYDIPCNRKARTGPDGICPECGVRHDDEDEDGFDYEDEEGED